ncbi:MAG: hypothetical protein KGJ89_01635 [Patescibacteria group bacterium]|nr:hypothetical protein [Patescibacteria group bacterium]MDE2015211.1 hypothetical protein [Patescibacteria group bacterium]MDE2226638.1 hypothetical protein [Patescibacteria group bacterium]
MKKYLAATIILCSMVFTARAQEPDFCEKMPKSLPSVSLWRPSYGILETKSYFVKYKAYTKPGAGFYGLIRYIEAKKVGQNGELEYQPEKIQWIVDFGKRNVKRYELVPEGRHPEKRKWKEYKNFEDWRNKEVPIILEISRALGDQDKD